MILINLIIGLISASLIAYQLSLLRILSFIQFHYFAYMIISIALLGFGAAGTFISLFREKLLKFYEITLLLSSLLCSITIIGTNFLLSKLKFEPFFLLWDQLMA